MSLPVSPEFSYEREPDFGRETLERMASITGGRKVSNVKELFEDPVKSSVRLPIAIPLLVLCLAMLLLDIAETRFGMLPAMGHFARHYLRRLAAFRVARAPARGPRRAAMARPRGAPLPGGSGAPVVAESQEPSTRWTIYRNRSDKRESVWAAAGGRDVGGLYE
jgi:hypothetical protein